MKSRGTMAGLVALVAAACGVGFWLVRGERSERVEPPGVDETEPARQEPAPEPPSPASEPTAPVQDASAALEIRGSVVDAAGAPVAGAVVRSTKTVVGPAALDGFVLVRDLPREPRAEAETTTGEDGTFVLELARPGTYDVHATAAGCTPAAAFQVRVAAATAGDPLRLVVHEGLRLTGRVIHDGGDAVAGTSVAAAPWPESGASFRRLTERVVTICDAEGRFELPGLRPGKLIVAVTLRGAPTTLRSNVRVPADGPLEIHVGTGAWLEGRVLTEGETPVGGAEVTAVVGDGAAYVLASARTDPDGRYRVDGLPVLHLRTMQVRAEGYAPVPGSLERMWGEPGDAGVQLVAGRNERDVHLLAGATVRGRVVSAIEGEPLAGVRVDLVCQHAYAGAAYTTTTAEDGVFELVGAPQGPAVLLATKDGWTQSRDPVALLEEMGFPAMGRGPSAWDGKPDTGEGPNVSVTSAGEVIERALELSQGIPLTGRVVSLDGRPIGGAQVRVCPPPRAATRVMEGLGLSADGAAPRRTDAEGTFAFAGLRPDLPIVLEATAEGRSIGRSRTIVLEPDVPAPSVEIPLGVGGTLHGRVTKPDGTPLAGVRVSWRHEERRGDAPIGPFECEAPAFSASDGSFRFEHVPPGSHRVSFEHFGLTDHVEEHVQVTEGAETECVVELFAGLTVEGVVLDPAGQPFAGAGVFASWHGGFDFLATDARGHFAFRGVPAGEVTLKVHAAGFEPVKGETKIDAGSVPVVLHLSKPSTISGRVVFAGDGRPVEGATVRARGLAGQGDRRIETGPGGAFSLAGLAAGQFELQVFRGRGEGSPNFVSKTVEPVDAGTQNLQIEVQEGLELAGEIVFADGSPLATGSVVCQPIDERGLFDRERRPSRVRATVKDGRWRIRGLLPGRYRLYVSLGGQSQKVDVEAGTTDLRIELGP